MKFKKIFKFFVFIFVLFCSFAFINKCSALTSNDVVDYLYDCKEENYFGGNLEALDNKTIDFDSFKFDFSEEDRENLYTLFSDSKVNLSRFNTFICTFFSNDITFYFYNYSNEDNCIYGYKKDDGAALFSYNSESLRGILSIKRDSSTGKLFISSYDRITDDYVNNTKGEGIGISSLSSLINYQFLSYSDVYLYESYSSDIKYQVLKKFVSRGGNIYDKNSKINISFKYNDIKTLCHVDVTIKDGNFTDKLFYSNYVPGINGELNVGKTEFPRDGLDLTTNISLFFQAEDKDGNIIAKNGLSITGIGSLSYEDFNVKFDMINRNETFICTYKNINMAPYYDIYLTVDGFEVYRMSIVDSYNLINTNIDYSTEQKINNNTLYNVNATLGADLNFKFKVVNNTTNKVVIIKSYSLHIPAKLHDDLNISGGTITDSNGNTSDMNSSNDSNITNSNNMFGNINSNSSFSDIISSVEETFRSFGMFFSIFPSFIWAIISSGLIVLIVLRVLGR